MIGLTNGTYQVSVVPTDEEYNMTVISNAEVSASDTTDIGTIDLVNPE